MSNLWSLAEVESLVRLALQEDKASADITSTILFDESAKASASIVAREELCMCGGPLLSTIFRLYGKEVELKQQVKEGEWAKRDEKLINLNGPARVLLACERVVLNFLQRLCGVATFSARVAKEAHSITVLDTRKTTPGFRALEKYAVRVGGLKNHRMNLAEMILIKNNHIDAFGAGGLEGLLSALRQKNSQGSPVEVEVRDLKELEIALKYGVSRVMFDNFSDEQIVNGLKLCRGSPSTQIEISGGVDSKRLISLAKLGVKLVSMGSLTTKSTNVDISMKISAASV